MDRCLGYLQLDLRATARRGAKNFDFGQAAKIFDYQQRIFGNLLGPGNERKDLEFLDFGKFLKINLI